MSFLDLSLHLLNFVAPAFFVALLLAATGRLGRRGSASGYGFFAQWGLNFVAGAGVLLAGLVAFGQDGRMATYAALMLVCGSLQWWLTRRARR